jgi:hypothetical protein
MSSLRLTQSKSFGRRQIVELLSPGELKVTLVSPAKSQEMKMPLAGFNEVPLRRKQFHWLPLLAVVPMACLILLMAAVAGYALTHGTSPVGAFFLGIGLLGLAVPFGLKVVLGSFNVLAFESPRGNRVALWFENPSKAEFENFVEALKAAIIKANRDAPVPQPSMSAELQKLKYLFDEGAINAAQFEAAKNRIVGLDDKGPIGF